LEQLIERFLKIRIELKLAAVAGVIVVMSAVVYFFWITDLQDKEAANQAQIRKLDDDLIQKQAIANNLQDFRRQKELLEEKLQEALTELPNDANIDELLGQLNEVGVKAGLQLASVEPGVEAKEGSFYSKIPVKLSLIGNYHEIAMFFDLVGKLKRIVNVSDIQLKTPEKRGDKIVLKVDCLATTFRFTDTKATSKAGAPGPAAPGAPPTTAPPAAPGGAK
jgi:type IV pilus assembly protein PilO